MPVAQGLSQGSSIRKSCASHQQTRVPGRLTCSRRSPSSRLSLNARTQSPAPQQFARSARSCRRQLKQHKKDCSCPSFSVCGCRQTTVCGAGTAHPEEERAGQGSHDSFSSNVSIPTTGMAKGLGSFGGATLERSKLDTKQEVKTQEPRVDNSGGGGNNGKNIFNGGGGDGDDGDDDDYFDEFGDGDGDGDGDDFFRTVVQQLYTKEAIDAVLQEWFRTVTDLPAIIRQSVQMGLFSSAQLVRFLSMDVRPNVTRAVTRTMPPAVSRGVVGRLMADPAFVQKMLVEQVISVSSTLAWEARQRGENFTKELDLVAINTLSVAAATGALVWLIAPNRSYGAVHKFPWQNMLQSMPNNLFDASTPYRQFSMGNRAASLVVKSAELCAVGSIAGAAMSGLSQLAVNLRQHRDPSFTPSVPIPDLAKSTAGMGMYMALSANLRYQAVSGIDRGMFDHCNVLWMYLGCSSAVRLCNNLVGEATRRWLQGIPTHSPALLQQRAPVAVAPAPVAQAKRKKPVKSSKKKRSSGNKGFEMSAGVHAAAA